MLEINFRSIIKKKKRKKKASIPRHVTCMLTRTSRFMRRSFTSARILIYCHIMRIKALFLVNTGYSFRLS